MKISISILKPEYINWEINNNIIFNIVNDGMLISIFVWIILFELYITEILIFWDQGHENFNM